jgi:hypothetical protein
MRTFGCEPSGLVSLRGEVNLIEVPPAAEAAAGFAAVTLSGA